MATQFESISQRIIRTLKETFGSTFHEYYDGDPYAIPDSMLPAIIVEQQSARITAGATGLDRNTETVVIKVVLDKRDDFNKDENINNAYQQQRDFIFARDPSTKEWLSKSIMGQIRTNFTLDDVVVGQSVDVQYFIQQRPEETYTDEAHVTIEATELVPVSGRN